MNKIYFHELNVKSALVERRPLKEYLLTLFYKENTQVKRVDIIFCNDKYLLSLNRSYLKHDYETDTMSFLLSDPKQPVVGELYLSIDRIKSNALELKIPYHKELLRVIIHSCLHLCGYKDHPKTLAKKMETIQEHYLKQWLVSRET